MTASGKILVKRKTAEKAKFTMSIKFDNMKFGDEEQPSEMKKYMKMMASTFEFTISKYGTITGGRYAGSGEQQLLLDMIFPLPDKTIKKDEIFTREVNIPPTGNQLSMEGTIKTVFSEASNLKGYDCVKLINTIDIKSLSSPDSMTKGAASWKGKGISYFAYKEGFFVELDSNMTLSMTMAFPMKDKTEKMAMQQSHQIHIELIPSQK
ncbi:MAG: hypothetical protein HY762_05005 [Planctomycetes bacterium]|nr:hypothetical protein [Planctomycetota bacterium]